MSLDLEVGSSTTASTARSESTGSVSPSEAVWRLLDKGARPVDATRALFGLSPAAARYVVGREMLISEEAERLLDATPHILRYMVNQQSFREVRSAGAVVGPIQWHSTIMARAAAGFPEDLFVCAAPYRDFNLPENQLLAYTLSSLVSAGKHVSALARNSFDDERTSLARERARQAQSLLEFRSLSGVKPARDPHTVRRVQRSSNRSTYEPLLAFLPRAKRPLSEWAITHLGDRRTSLQHKILLAVLATLMKEGVSIRPFGPSNGALTAGPVEYRHPGARGAPGAHGIRVGDLLIDVPDVAEDHDWAIRRLGQRSGMLTPILVSSVAEVSDLADRLREAAEIV